MARVPNTHFYQIYWNLNCVIWNPDSLWSIYSMEACHAVVVKLDSTCPKLRSFKIDFNRRINIQLKRGRLPASRYNTGNKTGILKIRFTVNNEHSRMNEWIKSLHISLMIISLMKCELCFAARCKSKSSTTWSNQPLGCLPLVEAFPFLHSFRTNEWTNK